MKNKVKEYREKIEISQEILGQKSYSSRQTINVIEIGDFVPSILLALRIAKVLNANVEDLFFLEESDLK